MQVPSSAEVREFARRCAGRDARDPQAYPADNIADLFRLGLLTAPFLPADGGCAMSLPDAARAVQTIAAASPSTALLAAMPLGLAGISGMGLQAAPEPYRNAWAEQASRVAADFTRGVIYAACNSEKGAGGSLASLKTIARRDDAGVFRLTGEKILASFGSHAGVFFSAAKVDQADLAGAGVAEFFFVPAHAPGVAILDDWDGFGMRSTESQSVHYEAAPATEVLGFPNFIESLKPLGYWFCLFTAIPLGCASGMLTALGRPAPASPAMRSRLADALMRYEALDAYLQAVSREWRPAGPPDLQQRVLRMKTHVSQEATRLCADLFALAGGRHYRRDDPLARLFAASFAGTSLRPPLGPALESLQEGFGLDGVLD